MPLHHLRRQLLALLQLTLISRDQHRTAADLKLCLLALKDFVTACLTFNRGRKQGDNSSRIKHLNDSPTELQWQIV